MSHEHTRFALVAGKHFHLSARAAHLLLVLAARANRSGDSYPGLDRLASDLCRHRTNVVPAVAELEAAGLIEVARRPGKANRYRVIVHDVPTSSASATTLRSASGSASATNQYRQRYGSSSASATRTVTELVNEQGAAHPHPSAFARCPARIDHRICSDDCTRCAGTGHVLIEAVS
jgi:DNA-binding MarR family transcriptional regulator